MILMNTVLHANALDANRNGRLTLLQAIGQVPWVLFGAFLFLPGAGMLVGFVYSLTAGTYRGDVGNGLFVLIVVLIFSGVLMVCG
jgi:hypothetical protein